MTDIVADEAAEQSKQVEKLLDDAVKQIESGQVKWDDIVKLVAPPAAPVVVPEVLPVPAQITATQKAALERLSDVYGKVVPLERRSLELAEVTSLVVEHETLGEIKSMADDRRTEIRTTVLNHNDVLVESDIEADAISPDEVKRDKDGHYIFKRAIPGEPGTSQKFSCEPKKGDVKLDPKALKALGDDPEVDWFTHKDYLEMTEQVRIFSEERAMLLLKKKPGLVRAIREATVTGNPSISLNLRKA